MSERCGPFRVLGTIGQGGMAEVLLAEGEDGARVALKRVLPSRSEPRFLRMFLDEARIASALDHPSIVRVLASGEDEGTPWIAMERIDGRDAASLGADGRDAGLPMPELAALRVVIDVARALAYAHEARDAEGRPLGIVHRDVSPSNVLLARDGAVKLGDFGIAKAEGRLEQTSLGSTKGKAAFMSPEQLLGSEVDRRTDVFALGCTLCALLTGQSAIRDESDTAALVAGQPLALPPELPEDLRAIVARAVAPSRARRYASASAMADALEEALAARGGDGREVLRAWIASVERASPRTPAPRAITRATTRATVPARAARRRSWLPALGLAAGVVLTGAASWLAISSRAAPPEEHAAERDPPRPPSLGEPDAGAPAPVAVTVAIAVPEPEPEPQPEPERELAGARGEARAARRERREERAPPATEEPAASAPAERGFVAVGGPGAIRAMVWIDGAPRDFAPLLVELSAGEHLVEVRDASGERIDAQRVRVRGDHTRRSPLRVIVEAPASP